MVVSGKLSDLEQASTMVSNDDDGSGINKNNNSEVTCSHSMEAQQQ
jgi:hypothetical protein